MNTTDILKAIITGKLDADLDRIRDAISDRRKSVRAMETQVAMTEIAVGDTVRLKDLSPKYINGIEAEVTEKRNTRIVVKLKTAIRKYHAGTQITVPANCVDVVSPE